MKDNHCWGCGADNPDGLLLKSEWDGEETVARWSASPVFAAGPRHILNGGIIATLLDCHGVCTALADAYRREGRMVGSDPEIWHATTAMDIRYLRPTPIEAELTLRGNYEHNCATFLCVHGTSLDNTTEPDDDDESESGLWRNLRVGHSRALPVLSVDKLGKLKE